MIPNNLITPDYREEGEYVVVDLPIEHDYVIIDLPPPSPPAFTYVERIYTWYLSCREIHFFYQAYETANPLALGRVVFRNTVTPLARLTGMQRVIDGAQLAAEGVTFAAAPIRYTTGHLLYWGAERLSQTTLTAYHPEIQGTVRVIIRANRELIQGPTLLPQPYSK